MSVFAWRRRMTRHFGEQWISFAELHLMSTKRRWHAFSVQVDSGAVISVMPRSAADLLGIQLENGEPIDLAGVGASARPFFVHRIPARIGDLPEFALRVAVADHEDVPNLLGRLDVLDRFRIDFNPLFEETRFSQPQAQGA
jgi:hypothetical protein